MRARHPYDPVRPTVALERRRRRRPRRRPNALLPLASVALGIVLVVIAVPGLLRHRASAVNSGRAIINSTLNATAETPAQPAQPPTPLVARYRRLDIHMPIQPSQLTMLAFHQASYTDALRMRILVPYQDPQNGTALHRPATAGQPGVLAGRAIRLWRSGRVGQPDTAADCGTKAGTTAVSPVTGEVIGVRRYRLYGRYPDYQVHIQPDGYPHVDCVVIHIEQPLVKKGDRVVGGVTPISRVRMLSNRFHIQLGEYTHEAGDHVHFQFNTLETPGVMPPLRGE